MKQKLLIVAVAASLAACSTTKNFDASTGESGVYAGNNVKPISEQTISGDFTRQEVKVLYTTFGNLEGIEARGYAPYNGGRMGIEEAALVAKQRAKSNLANFLNPQNIKSNTSTDFISKSIEMARDAKERKNVSSDGTIVINEADVAQSGNMATNTAVRDDSIKAAQRLQENITTSTSAIIKSGVKCTVRSVEAGKSVEAVCTWLKKDRDSALQMSKW